MIFEIVYLQKKFGGTHVVGGLDKRAQNDNDDRGLRLPSLGGRNVQLCRHVSLL